MQSPWDNLKQEIAKKLDADINEIEESEKFGDFAYPCFSLAKKKRKNPNEMAKEIAEEIEIKFVKKIEAVGPYVNFYIDWKRFSGEVLKYIFIKKRINAGKKIMVEYSQPNPVHPMHIGHARATFLGDSLANIYDFLGNKVIRANYMNNIGLQVAKLVTAYLEWAKNKKPNKKPDFWLWEYYVKFHEEANNSLDLEEKARKILRKFELEKERKTIEVWNRIVGWCVEGFKETYKRLGVEFDTYLYESDFRDSGKKIVDVALKKGIAFTSPEKTIVADLEKYGLQNLVILRSDGTGLYSTSDLGMTIHKFDKYKLDKSVWVVSSQQDLYFKQHFKILELLGHKWSKNCYHFSFEHVVLPEGKMSSREGRAIMIDEVIERLTRLAYEEVSKRNSKLPEKIKKKIAEIVGIGAFKYAILKIEPHSVITFDWKQMLSFDGDTGPYLQYAHTRCLGILKNAKKWRNTFYTESLSEYEIKLIKHLAKFLTVVENSAKDFRPHYICNYVYDLATIFSSFYQNCQVIKAEKGLRDFRLTLVEATKVVLEKSLSILGIGLPEKM